MTIHLQLLTREMLRYKGVSTYVPTSTYTEAEGSNGIIWVDHESPLI